MQTQPDPNPQHLAAAFSDEEVRTAGPERRLWLLRVLALAHQTNAPVLLARQAVEEVDRQAGEQTHANPV